MTVDLERLPEPCTEEIRVRGAREHNLRNLDVAIPRDRLVVVTGLSGSGKSSLAFDTLYAEGQRRYVESLSTYARQFLDQLQKPAVESIEGLSPSISIEQKTTSRNPRSTVGTATEIGDHLRLLYARAGEPHCWECGQPIASQSPGAMADRILGLPEGTASLLAPVVRGRRGSYRKELDAFRRRGFVRARIDGEMRDLSEDIELARGKRHDIEVVVDRVKIGASSRARLIESIQMALELADGLLLAETDGPEPVRLQFSRSNACPDCGTAFPELAPRFFSFNSPAGACPGCRGLGVRRAFAPDLLVPDPQKSLAENPIAAWGGRHQARYYGSILESLARHFDVDLDTPWAKLPKKVRDGILHGTGGREVDFELRPRRRRAQRVTMAWDGVVDELERRLADKEERGGGTASLDRYRRSLPCGECEGARLRVEARHVTLAGRGIHELGTLSIGALHRFLAGLSLDSTRGVVAERILAEIRERLGFLEDVGLDYLSLDRPTATLSGGEGQRIRLATQIGASLMGVLYILDEPSIGLHARDNQKLLESLLRLRDMGNSVVVVEHDEATIRAADHVIDMGPGAGAHGGEIVAEGPPEALLANPASLTGAYLAGSRRVPIPAQRRSAEKSLVLSGCTANNLQDVELRIPLGCFTVVTGVSGSGKSTLVGDTLHRALAARLHGALETPGAFARLEGVEDVDKVIDVDQSPIGRSPRSNPATFSNAFGPIRNLFAQVPEARVRGYGPGRFSFNVKGGRCEACEGDGALRVEMSFLPDTFVTCEACAGQRYNRETLDIRYKGRNVAEVLDMTVEEGLAFMENVPPVRRPLQALADVGLGYLKLGQPATTLSGGEAQRIKLAKELGRRSSGRTLYLLDEPTTGLHFADIAKLLELLDRLVEMGNSVVVIEHQLDVIQSADHVVDLGPGGGEAGGRIVATGTPEQVAASASGPTAVALAEHLAARGAAS